MLSCVILVAVLWLVVALLVDKLERIKTMEPWDWRLFLLALFIWPFIVPLTLRGEHKTADGSWRC